MDTNTNLKLSDIFLMIKEFILFYKSFRKINMLLVLVSFVGCFVFYKIEKAKYEASSSFVLMEGSGSKAGGLASLGSQFGIDLGAIGGQSNSIFSGDNIFDIFKTRELVEKVLLSPYTKTTNEQNTTTLADQYLKMYPSFIRNVILRKPISSVSFLNYDPKNKPDRLKDEMLSKIHSKIIANNLVVQKLNKKGSIIQVVVTTNDEYFSKIFTERIIDAAKHFYLNINNTNTQQVLVGLQQKADSLQKLLYQKSFQSVGLFNSNNGLKAYTANEEISQKDKTVAFTLYAEVIKNIELTKMAQAQQTPIFQLVETPRYPLANKKFTIVELILIGALMGLIFTFIHALVKFMFT